MYISLTGIDANVRAMRACAHIYAHACAHAQVIFDVLLLYGQKAIFRKKNISVHRKIVRNEGVLMNLSYIFLKNVTPSIFALPHSKMTKTPNFHASYLCLHPHDRPLVLDIASSCCPASTYIKIIMSQWLHHVHSRLVGTII